MITEIKKGDKFVCVKAYDLSDMVVGKVYTSPKNGEIDLDDGASWYYKPGIGSPACLLNEHFIPYTYKALSDHYNLMDKGGDSDMFLDLIRNFSSYIIDYLSDNDIAKPDCQGNCTSCQCDPDVQHELEKEGIEQGYADKTMADHMRISMNKTIKGIEDITGLKLTCPSLNAKVGDYIRCVKELRREGDPKKFGVGGHNKILSIHNDFYYLTKEAFVSIKELDEHFVIDNSIVSDILENTPTPDIRLPPYYNNDNGSLYKIAEQRGWNFYQADCVKRIDRCLKKGQFKEDITKTIALLNLWLKESEL